MITAAVICVAIGIGLPIGDWVPGPYRGAISKWIVGRILWLPKLILRLPKQHKELTELGRAQEDKEIEVIIRELDKELAERNG
jgi:hypothetical protein